MKNGWYPREKLGNKNIPEGAVILGSKVSMSGEIITTYYSFGYDFHCVEDWKGSYSQHVTAKEVIAAEKYHDPERIQKIGIRR